MAIDHDRLMAIAIPDTAQSYSQRDAIFYALSLGLGTDPLDVRELPFVYEENLRCLPTFGGILCHPGFWLREMDTGVDWVKVVHAEHEVVLHRPLPPRADLIGRSRVTDIIDRGEGRGALIIYERAIADRDSGEPLCTITMNMLARGDGGFGGPPRQLPPPPAIPERAPDLVHDTRTSPRMALLYRLNGDWNPLHADPAAAKRAGFERPILHGLATWGVAGAAVVKTVCDYRPERIASFFGRFTAPVHPGETFRTEMWLEGNEVRFRVRALERDVIAIDNGRARLRATP